MSPVIFFRGVFSTKSSKISYKQCCCEKMDGNISRFKMGLKFDLYWVDVPLNLQELFSESLFLSFHLV